MGSQFPELTHRGPGCFDGVPAPAAPGCRSCPQSDRARRRPCRAVRLTGLRRTPCRRPWSRVVHHVGPVGQARRPNRRSRFHRGRGRAWRPARAVPRRGRCGRSCRWPPAPAPSWRSPASTRRRPPRPPRRVGEHRHLHLGTVDVEGQLAAHRGRDEAPCGVGNGLPVRRCSTRTSRRRAVPARGGTATRGSRRRHGCRDRPPDQHEPRINDQVDQYLVGQDAVVCRDTASADGRQGLIGTIRWLMRPGTGGRSGEEVADFGVAGLVEPPIGLADRADRVGGAAQFTSSATRVSSWQVSAGVVGTAIMTRAGAWAPMACRGAFIVAPVSKSVVDDDGLAGDVGLRAAVTVGALTTLAFRGPRLQRSAPTPRVMR